MKRLLERFLMSAEVKAKFIMKRISARISSNLITFFTKINQVLSTHSKDLWVVAKCLCRHTKITPSIINEREARPSHAKLAPSTSGDFGTNAGGFAHCEDQRLHADSLG